MKEGRPRLCTVHPRGLGLEYGTERSRLRDRTRLVGDECLDGFIGHVYETGLVGNPLKRVPGAPMGPQKKDKKCFKNRWKGGFLKNYI